MSTGELSLTTGELAALLSAPLTGDPGVRLTGVDGLERAGPGDLSFVRSARFAAEVAKSRAGALLVSRGVELPAQTRPVIVVDDADRALISILAGIRQRRFGPPASGRHPTALIDPRAELHESVAVGPGAIIEHAVTIGAGTRVLAGAIIFPGTTIGARCVIGPRVVLGYEGFGYVADPETGARTHLPHVGGVRIGDDVEIGAGTCIDRGKLADTVIGDGSKIDNLVQIGHNCRIGRNVVICGQAGLAGSVTIGDRVVLAGQVGIADAVTIGDDALILAQAGVIKSLPGASAYIGMPARPREDFAKETAAIRRLARERLHRRDSHDKGGPA
jgi:UDP-3-O-[3-hydroxymyristoyl] glucosamine N-acyltransferase